MQFFDLNNYMVDMIYELVPGVRRQRNWSIKFPLSNLSETERKRLLVDGHFYISTGTYYCWNAGCAAYDKGMSGLQFLSALTNRPQYDIKAELIKRANTFNNHKPILQEEIVKPIKNILEDKQEENIYKINLENR